MERGRDLGARRGAWNRSRSITKPQQEHLAHEAERVGAEKQASSADRSRRSDPGGSSGDRAESRPGCSQDSGPLVFSTRLEATDVKAELDRFGISELFGPDAYFDRVVETTEAFVASMSEGPAMSKASSSI